jgi:hypothetical protein
LSLGIEEGMLSVVNVVAMEKFSFHQVEGELVDFIKTVHHSVERILEKVECLLTMFFNTTLQVL